MAFTLKDSLSFTGTGTASSVHLNNLTTGDASFVAVAVNQSSTNRISSVTDSSSNTYTRAGISYAGTNIMVELWYCINATLTTSTTVTVTPNVGTDVWSAVWAIFSGAGTAGVYDKTAGTSGTSVTSADTGSTVTTSNASELILGVFGQANNRPFNVGTGYSSINQAANSTSAECFMEYKTVASTGTYNATASWDLSSNWAGGVYTFTDAVISGGGGATIRRLGLLGVG